jgi:hypothetical protein
MSRRDPKPLLGYEWSQKSGYRSQQGLSAGKTAWKPAVKKVLYRKQDAIGIRRH